MHWPGASMMLVLGFTVSIPSFIIYLIARYKDKENARLGTYGAYMFVVFLGIGLTVYQGIGATRDLLNNFIDVSKSSEQQVESLKLLIEDENFNKYNGIRMQTQEVIELISQGKLLMIEESGGVDQNDTPLGKDNQDISAQHYLVAEEGVYGRELEIKINNLHQAYVDLYGGDSDKVIFKPAVGMDTYYGGHESWSSITFEYSTLAAVLSKLSNIQASILGAELVLFNHLDKTK
jgi:hypothetical protein